jgi:hypothetical protein
LRQYRDQIASEEVHLYTPADVVRYQNPSEEGGPKPVLVGKNPPSGALIYFHLKDKPKAEVKLEILDGSGRVIRKYSSARREELNEPLSPDDKKPEKQITPEAGLNRFVWDLRYEATSHVPDYYLWAYREGTLGPLALPGKYQVRLTVGDKSQTAAFELKLDPRVKVAQADLQKQFDLLMQIHDELTRVFDTVNQVQDVRSQIEGLKRRIPETVSTKSLLSTAGDLDEKLVAVRDDLVQMKIHSNEDSVSYPQKVDSKLAALAMAVGDGSDSAPTEAEYRVFDKLKKQADDSMAHWAELQKTDLTALQKRMAEQNILAIVVSSGEGAGGAGESPR